MYLRRTIAISVRAIYIIQGGFYLNMLNYIYRDVCPLNKLTEIGSRAKTFWEIIIQSTVRKQITYNKT